MNSYLRMSCEVMLVAPLARYPSDLISCTAHGRGPSRARRSARQRADRLLDLHAGQPADCWRRRGWRSVVMQGGRAGGVAQGVHLGVDAVVVFRMAEAVVIQVSTEEQQIACPRSNVGMVVNGDVGLACRTRTVAARRKGTVRGEGVDAACLVAG